jgi:hypothetical protein
MRTYKPNTTNNTFLPYIKGREPIYNPFDFKYPGYEYDVQRANFGVDEYGRSINAYTPEHVLSAIQAINQPFWDGVYRTVVGGVHKGLVGAAKSFAFLGEAFTPLDSLRNTETWVDNSIVHVLGRYQDDLEKKYKIYDSGTWNWDDGNFIFKSLQSIIEMATEFGLPGGVVGKSISIGTKALSGYKLFNFLSNATGKLVTDAILAGAASNYMEGKLMGLETKKNLMAQFTDAIAEYHNSGGEKGISFTDAEKIATQAGISVMNINRVMMLSDISTFGRIFKGFSGATRNMLPSNIKEYVKKYGKDFFFEGFKEGGEEFTQGLFERESEYKAIQKFNEVSKNMPIITKLSKNGDERFFQYLSDGNLWYESFLGVFGGLPQKALAGMINATLGRNQNKQTRQIQQQTIAATSAALNSAIGSWATTQPNTTAAAYNANIQGQQAGATTPPQTNPQAPEEFMQAPELAPQDLEPYYTEDKRTKTAEFVNLAFKHFSAGTTEYLEKMLQDLAAMTPEQAKEAGITEGAYSQVAAEMLNMLPKLERSFDDALNFKENRANIYLASALKKIYEDDFDATYSEALNSMEKDLSRKLNDKKKVKNISGDFYIPNVDPNNKETFKLVYEPKPSGKNEAGQDIYDQEDIARGNAIAQEFTETKEFRKILQMYAQTASVKDMIKALDKEIKYLRSSEGQKEGAVIREGYAELLNRASQSATDKSYAEEQNRRTALNNLQTEENREDELYYGSEMGSDALDQDIDAEENETEDPRKIKPSVKKEYDDKDDLSNFKEINKRRQAELDSKIPVKQEKITVDFGDKAVSEFEVITYKNGSVRIRYGNQASKVYNELSEEAFQDYVKFDFAEDAKGIIKTEIVKDDYSDDESQKITASITKSVNKKYDAEIEALKQRTPDRRSNLSDLLDELMQAPEETNEFEEPSGKTKSSSSVKDIEKIKTIIDTIRKRYEADPNKKNMMNERIANNKSDVNFKDILDELYKSALHKGKEAFFENKNYIYELSTLYYAYRLAHYNLNPEQRSALGKYLEHIVDTWKPLDKEQRSADPAEFTKNKISQIYTQFRKIIGASTMGTSRYLKSIVGPEKLAYLSKVWDYLTDENMNTVRQDFNRELSKNAEIETHDLKKIQTGDKIYFKVLHNHDGYIYAPKIVNESGAYTTTRSNSGSTKIKWSTYSKKLDINSDEYIAEVPIEIYRIDSETGDEKRIGFLHSTSWLNQDNMVSETDFANARRRLQNARKVILKNSDATTGIYKADNEITEVGSGAMLYHTGRTTNNPIEYSTKTMLPDPNIEFAIAKGNRLHKNAKTVAPVIPAYNDSSFFNQGVPSFVEGVLYALLPTAYNKNTNKYSYSSAMLLNSRVLDNNTKMAMSMCKAIEIYFKLKNSVELQPDEQVFYKNTSTTGLDLSQQTGLIKYLKLFLYSETPYDSIEKEIKTNNATKPSFYVTKENKIGFYSYVSQNNEKNIIDLNGNEQDLIAKLDYLFGTQELSKKKHPVISDFYINFDINKINSKTQVSIYKDEPISYQNFIKENTVTSYYGINIGTESEPNWIYTVQRNIIFSLPASKPQATVDYQKAKQTIESVLNVDGKNKSIEKELQDIDYISTEGLEEVIRNDKIKNYLLTRLTDPSAYDMLRIQEIFDLISSGVSLATAYNYNIQYSVDAIDIINSLPALADYSIEDLNKIKDLIETGENVILPINSNININNSDSYKERLKEVHRLLQDNFINEIIKIYSNKSASVVEDVDRIGVEGTAGGAAGDFSELLAPPHLEDGELSDIAEGEYIGLIKGVTPKLQKEIHNFISASFIQLIKTFGNKTSVADRKEFVNKFKEKTIPLIIRRLEARMEKTPEDRKHIYEKKINQLQLVSNNFEIISDKVNKTLDSYNLEDDSDSPDFERKDWSDESMVTQDQRRKLSNRTKLLLSSIPILQKTIVTENGTQKEVYSVKTNEYDIPVYADFNALHDVFLRETIERNGTLYQILKDSAENNPSVELQSLRLHFRRHGLEIEVINKTSNSEIASNALKSDYKSSSNFDETIEILKYTGMLPSYSTEELKKLKTNYFKIYEEFIKDLAHAHQMTFVNMKKVIFNDGISTVINSNSSDVIQTSITRWSDAMLSKTVSIDGIETPLFTYNEEVKQFVMIGKAATYFKNELDKVSLAIKNIKSSITKYKAGPNEEISKNIINDVKFIYSTFGIDLTEMYIRDLVTKDIDTLAKMIKNFENYYFNVIPKPAFSSAADGHPTVKFIEHFDLYRQSFVFKLAKGNSKYSNAPRPRSHRDGGKNVWEYAPSMLFTDILTAVKNNFKGHFGKLKSSVFSSGSYLLSDVQSLKEISNFTVALNPLSGDDFEDGKLSDRNAKHQEVFRINTFMSRSEPKLTSINGINVSIRKAPYLYITTSDKTRVVGLDNMPVAFFGDDIIIDDNLKYESFFPTHEELLNTTMFSESALQFYMDQVIMPEFKRMHYVLNNANRFSNNFVNRAKLFYFTPLMNAVANQIKDEKGIDIRTLTPNEFLNIFNNQTRGTHDAEIATVIRIAIANQVLGQAFDKLDFWRDNGIGFNFDKKKKAYVKNNLIPKNHLDLFKGTDIMKIVKAAIDYEMSSAIANSNVYQIFSTDIANYSEKIVIDVDNANDSEILKAIVDTFDNAGKRLARDITPGHKHFSSHSNKFVNLLVLKDPKIDSKLLKEYKHIWGDLAFDSYGGIKIADGQGYTDWKHALDFLYGVRKISLTHYKYLEEKFTAQENDIDKHGHIKEQNLVSEKEVKKLLSQLREGYMPGSASPQKPVGTVNYWSNKRNDFIPIYLKQSDLPLIPQLTNGFEIDSLRQLMKRGFKNEEGKKVRIERASYQSAIKIDTGYDPLMITTNDNTFALNDDIYDSFDGDFVVNSKVSESIIKNIPYDGIRFQQDSPYKDTKSDMSRVSQVMILITSLLQGVSGFDVKTDLLKKINDNFINRRLSTASEGSSLIEIYNRLVGILFEEAKKELHKKLNDTKHGLNKKAITRILIREAIDRGYDEKYIRFLKDAKSLSQIKFTQYADATETLLQSIITNKVMTFKMPGSSSVIASNSLFKHKKQIINTEQAQNLGLFSDMIYTSFYNGEELQSKPLGKSDTSDQMFVTNFIRNERGEVIDLWEKDKEGNYKYLIKKEGKLHLNEEIISPEVLKAFSMRIPNAGYNSSASTQIAGIFPPTFGTLAIASEDLIARIGHDFDLDKLYNYFKYLSTDSYKDKELEWRRKSLEEEQEIIIEELIEEGDKVESYKNIKNAIKPIKGQVINLKTKKGINAFLNINPDLTEEFKDALSKLASDQTAWDISNLENVSEELADAINIVKNNFDSATAQLKALHSQLRALTKNFKSKGLLKQIERVEEIDNEISDLDKELSDMDDSYSNVRFFDGDDYIKNVKNAILSIYDSVYENPDLDVQKAIRTPTTYGDGVFDIGIPNSRNSLIELAEYIDSFYSKNSLSRFSGISAEYQRFKYFDGTGAKSGVGVFATNNVVHALLNSVPTNAKLRMVRIENPGTDEAKKIQAYTPLGKNPSVGEIGRSKTLADSSINTSDIINPTLQLDLDNEKLQAAHKLRINSATYSVVTLAQSFGYGAEIFLLMNQPLTRRFIDKISLSEEGLDTSMQNAFQESYDEVIDAIASQIPGGNLTQIKMYIDSIVTNNINEKITIDELKDSFEKYGSKQIDVEWHANQLRYLHRYYILMKQAEPFNKVTKALSISSKSVGKNVAESITALSRYGELIEKDGASVAFRDPLTSEELLFQINGFFNLMYIKQTLIEKVNDEEVEVDEIIPRLIPAYVYDNAIREATVLWDPIYEYNNASLYGSESGVFKKLLKSSGINHYSSKFAETLKHLYNNYISYMFSNQYGGHFNGSAKNERIRLFSKSSGNTTLRDVLIRLNDTITQKLGLTLTSGQNLNNQLYNEFDKGKVTKKYFIEFNSKDHFVNYVERFLAIAQPQGRHNKFIQKLFKLAVASDANNISDGNKVYNYLFKAASSSGNSFEHHGDINFVNIMMKQLLYSINTNELYKFNVKEIYDNENSNYLLFSDYHEAKDSIVNDAFKIEKDPEESMAAKLFDIDTDDKLEIAIGKFVDNFNLIKNNSNSGPNKIIFDFMKSSIPSFEAFLRLNPSDEVVRSIIIKAIGQFREERLSKTDFYSLNGLDLKRENEADRVFSFATPYIVNLMAKQYQQIVKKSLFSVLSTIKSLHPTYWNSNMLLRNLILKPSDMNVDFVQIYSASVEPEYDAVIREEFLNMIMSDNQPVLYTANGIDYTPRTIALDLVSMTLLGGGIQKAKELVKYLPIEYLQAIGFYKKLGNIDLKKNSFTRMLNIHTSFKDQIAQHDYELFVKNLSYFANKKDFNRFINRFNVIVDETNLEVKKTIESNPGFKYNFVVNKDFKLYFTGEPEIANAEYLLLPGSYVGDDTVGVTYLYKRIPETDAFHVIPKLGHKNFKEFDSNVDHVTSSVIESNNKNAVIIDETGNQKPLYLREYDDDARDRAETDQSVLDQIVNEANKKVTYEDYKDLFRSNSTIDQIFEFFKNSGELTQQQLIALDVMMQNKTVYEYGHAAVNGEARVTKTKFRIDEALVKSSAAFRVNKNTFFLSGAFKDLSIKRAFDTFVHEMAHANTSFYMIAGIHPALAKVNEDYDNYFNNLVNRLRNGEMPGYTSEEYDAAVQLQKDREHRTLTSVENSLVAKYYPFIDRFELLSTVAENDSKVEILKTTPSSNGRGSAFMEILNFFKDIIDTILETLGVPKNTVAYEVMEYYYTYSHIKSGLINRAIEENDVTEEVEEQTTTKPQENLYSPIATQAVANYREKQKKQTTLSPKEQSIVEEIKKRCFGGGGLRAKDGMTNAVVGTNWKIVKDFKGQPKHSQGGVDITISNSGVSFKKGEADIKAEYGLLIPNDLKEEDGTLIVSELYKKRTGEDWNKAKAKGLTSGSYDDNIKLRDRLLKGEFDNTSKQEAAKPIAAPSQTELNQDYTKAKDFKEAFKIARQQLGANQIFEYQGRKYGTNLAGESFNPSEEILKKFNMNTPEVKERLTIQSKLVESVFSTKQTAKLEPEYQDWDKVKQRQDEINRMAQVDIIKQYHKNSEEQYVIVDKKRGKMHLMQGGKEISSYNVGTGENFGDEQTRTWVDKETKKVDWDKGNKQTGAGIYTVSARDSKNKQYHAPSWNFTNEYGIEVPMAIHGATRDRVGKIQDKDETNNRVSNGCINGICYDLEDLYRQGYKEGQKLYVLPDNDNNKFELKNGKLVFTSSDQNVNRTVNTLNYKPIKIEVSEKLKSEAPEAVRMAETLVNKKQELMKALKINGDIYNDLASLTLGLAGQESKYGTSLKYNLKTELTQDLAKWASGNKSYNSKGLTQIKFDGVNSEVKELFKKYGITKDNIDKGDNAAVAQMIMFAHAYNNELPAYKATIKELGISETDALLYLNQGKRNELVNKTATPNKNMYIQNVKNFAKDFTIKELN